MDALETAGNNAARLGLADRATFIACDYASGLSGTFDLIVSNPPYIRSADIELLARDVREHDPRAAVFDAVVEVVLRVPPRERDEDGAAPLCRPVEEGGLDAVVEDDCELVPQAAGFLAPGAVLVVEAGRGQSGEIEALMSASGLVTACPPKADLAGIKRAVAGRKLPR